MAQSSKRKRRKQTPPNVDVDVDDAKLAEKVFGKRLKLELDREVERVDGKGVTKLIQS